MPRGRGPRILGSMKLTAVLVALPVVLTAAPALAGPKHNLNVAVTPPAGVLVDQFGHYNVRVTNTGNRNASGVTLTIALPRTHTSPQVFIMGNLANVDGRCSLSAQTLTCGLGQINKNGAYTDVGFDLKLPYSTAALDFTYTANPISGDANPANNTLATTVAPGFPSQPITTDLSMQHDHCTGTNLTSFFECALFPSSIAGFAADYAIAGNAITIPGEPDFSGTWSQAGGADHLEVTFSDLSGPVGSIDARAVGNGCFEGPMTFAPPSPYVAIYRICP